MFLTQIVNGEVSELTLCEACARAKGLFDPQSLTFAEKFFPEEFKKRVDQLVRELTEGETTPSAAGSPLDMVSQCPICGFSLEDYRRTGHLGCPDCYGVFSREFDPLADFEDAPVEETPVVTKLRLEKELQQAILREDYERAAFLRDQINALPRLPI